MGSLERVEWWAGADGVRVVPSGCWECATEFCFARWVTGAQ